jgi:hypothetical protein
MPMIQDKLPAIIPEWKKWTNSVSYLKILEYDMSQDIFMSNITFRAHQ